MCDTHYAHVRMGGCLGATEIEACSSVFLCREVTKEDTVQTLYLKITTLIAV